MYQVIRQFTKRQLVKAACKRLHLRPDLAELADPLCLMTLAGFKCNGIIHVGANTGHEFDVYRQANLQCAIYIEPIPELYAALKSHVSRDERHHAIQALCTDRTGDRVEFNIASNGGLSSSIYAMGSHSREYPEVKYVSKMWMDTKTLDDVIFGTRGISPNALDCIVMDVQGAELKVILGAPRTLSQCRYVFTEISEGGLYDGDAPYEEVLAALKSHGFAVRSLDLNEHGWGNAFLIKRSSKTI